MNLLMEQVDFDDAVHLIENGADPAMISRIFKISLIHATQLVDTVIGSEV